MFYLFWILHIKKNLILARKNAASDIFERINSHGTMGIINEEINQDGLVYIDLHGLFINEAKERVNEFILPILPVLKKAIVITGHGSHSQSRESLLKNAIQEYFISLGFECDEMTNKGTLCAKVKI